MKLCFYVHVLIFSFLTNGAYSQEKGNELFRRLFGMTLGTKVTPELVDSAKERRGNVILVAEEHINIKDRVLKNVFISINPETGVIFKIAGISLCASINEAATIFDIYVNMMEETFAEIHKSDEKISDKSRIISVSTSTNESGSRSMTVSLIQLNQEISVNVSLLDLDLMPHR